MRVGGAQCSWGRGLTSLHWCTSPSGSMRHTGHSMNDAEWCVGTTTTLATQVNTARLCRNDEGPRRDLGIEMVVVAGTVAGRLPLLLARFGGQFGSQVDNNRPFLASSLHVVPELLPARSRMRRISLLRPRPHGQPRVRGPAPQRASPKPRHAQRTTRILYLTIKLCYRSLKKLFKC